MRYVKIDVRRATGGHMNPNAIKKQIISLTEVNEYLALKESIQALKRRIELLTEGLDQSEKNIIAKLDLGANSFNCGLELTIRESQKRFPAWKEHFLAKCGKEAADEILSNTEPKIYRDLIIKRVA